MSQWLPEDKMVDINNERFGASSVKDIVEFYSYCYTSKCKEDVGKSARVAAINVILIVTILWAIGIWLGVAGGNLILAIVVGCGYQVYLLGRDFYRWYDAKRKLENGSFGIEHDDAEALGDYIGSLQYRQNFQGPLSRDARAERIENMKDALLHPEKWQTKE